MFAIQRIDHVVLRARDPEALTRFYETALGMKVERRLERIGLIQLRAGDSLLDLVPAGADGAGRNMDHLCFEITPFDPAEIRARLLPLGIDPGEPAERYGAKGTGPSIYFNDPEGNQIELKGPAHTPARRPA